MAVRWEEGVFLGCKATTGEKIIGTLDGVVRARTVRRRPEEERWNQDNLKWVRGVPWRDSGVDANADGEDMKVKELLEEERRIAGEGEHNGSGAEEIQHQDAGY